MKTHEEITALRQKNVEAYGFPVGTKIRVKQGVRRLAGRVGTVVRVPWTQMFGSMRDVELDVGPRERKAKRLAFSTSELEVAP